MALTYDLTGIDNSDALWRTNDKGERGAVSWQTEKIIFMCMIVGIGTITKANHKEWYDRAWAVDAVYAVPASESVTLGEVVRHIGLETNAGPTLSRAKFNTRLGRQALEEAIHNRKNKETLRARAAEEEGT